MHGRQIRAGQSGSSQNAQDSTAVPHLVHSVAVVAW